MSARNEAILKAFREHIRKPEVRAQIVTEAEEYAAYMALEKHKGNCHCVRCMAEFFAQGMSPGTAETGTGSGPKDGQPGPATQDAPNG